MMDLSEKSFLDEFLRIMISLIFAIILFMAALLVYYLLLDAEIAPELICTPGYKCYDQG